MHRPKPLSSTHEMYLKVLRQVGGERGVARLSDLARGLGVSPGTVSTVLEKLASHHLVEHQRYSFVALTPEGNSIAECVLRRYETIRTLLTEVLGVEPETAAIDACMMEHAVSPTTVSRMRSFLRGFRGGEVGVPRVTKHSPRTDPCSRCEALGVCQAEAPAPAR